MQSSTYQKLQKTIKQIYK